jgi:GT2 family glycosyltransferase
MVVRHEALREVGLMDLMGGEETEWHIRFREKGWKVVFHHEAEVIHLGSATVSKDPYRDLIELRGALNIYYKHMPPWRYALLRACCFLIYVGKYLAASLRWTSTAQDVARKALRLIIRWPNVRSGRNSE